MSTAFSDLFFESEGLKMFHLEYLNTVKLQWSNDLKNAIQIFSKTTVNSTSNDNPMLP